MAGQYILAFDQGTTSSRSILFNHAGDIVATAQQEFEQIFPQPGWVEHNAEEIWTSQRATAKAVLEKANATHADVAAIGITNQRETAVVWNRTTGKPIHNAIVWQCRRTTEICEALTAAGHSDTIRQKTGLVVDAYFTGTKIQWILDTVPGAREAAEKGDLCYGTIDAWLLYNLTGRHATDYSNASRTMLFNIHDLDWDEELLTLLKVPRAGLPEACPSSHTFGSTTVLGGEIPVASLIGDQQGALFGQAAFNPGESKNTYGTGCFLLSNTGTTAVTSENGLLTTIAWGVNDTVVYALEGSIFVGGAVIQWLRDALELIQSANETEALATAVEDNGGVYLVPAFTGLGAPWWDMRARGVITGLTRGASKAHIIRAALESIAYQSCDVLHTMEKDTGKAISRLKVDGGACANNFLMQFQADILDVPVERGQVLETTALGAAFLAGLAVGFWRDTSELEGIWQLDRAFVPNMSQDKRNQLLTEWNRAVNKAKSD